MTPFPIYRKDAYCVVLAENVILRNYLPGNIYLDINGIPIRASICCHDMNDINGPDHSPNLPYSEGIGSTEAAIPLLNVR